MENSVPTISVQDICDDINNALRNKTKTDNPIPPFPQDQSDIRCLNFLLQLKAKEDVINSDFKESIPREIDEAKVLIDQIEHVFNEN